MTFTKKILSSFFALTLLTALTLVPARAQQAASDTLFFEAENFTSTSNGWVTQQGGTVKRASRATVLSGSIGKGDAAATQEITIPRTGTWSIRVRYMEHSSYPGPFVVDVLSGANVIATHDFGLTPKPDVENWDFVWDSLNVALQPGKYTLRLRKYQNKNSSGYGRKIDCFLLTTDLTQEPDHIPFGPQTWMKVTLGTGYEKPVQIHVFADHYRSPWYAHYALTKGHVDTGTHPAKEHMKDKLSNGESTGWLDISQMVYQDSGAHLAVYPAYTYVDHAKTFNATIQFSNKPSDSAAVKTFKINYSPSTIHIVVPPNLDNKENIEKLRSDKEFAAEYGALADKYDWPKTGKKPVKFPFFVSSGVRAGSSDDDVVDREMKTLSYFGFNGPGSKEYAKYGFNHHSIGGAGWYMKGSYSAPDIEKMQARADALYPSQIKEGLTADKIDFAMVMDEPGTEALSKLEKDAASIDGFRAWIKSMNLTPQDLLVNTWDDVKPVADNKQPALFYYTQKYRTVALGNFLAIQKQLLQRNWKADFPIVANFSDGAVYYANFYGQGIDYFTLLHDTDQNAIWGEDWSNGAATYQDASFNVELMRAAARRNNQTIGHHLIAYAGRKGYDIRLKAVSEVARGVKILESFHYGPVWTTHENSPWQKFPHMWSDHAAVIREIGAVEDDLLPAMPQKAQVAVLYSSASDVWNQENLVYGFERMHTWLALTHAQIPVDVVGESDVAEIGLGGYKVCYLSDPNLTRDAALKLRDWVQAGGTLMLTAGAGEKDEYNRPLKTFNELLPYRRNAVQILQEFRASGRYLTALKIQEIVSEGDTKIDVLGVKQSFENMNGRSDVPPHGSPEQIKSTFAIGNPASIRTAAGKGYLICKGYLPALDYMRKALIAKNGVEELDKNLDENNGIPGPDDVEPLKLNEKSYNPWQYPTDIREAIIAPVHQAKVATPIVCSVPLVDAIYMTGGKNLLIPLANYTLQPIKDMALEVTVDKPVSEVKSVYQGNIKFEQIADNKIRFHLPLDCTDFVTIY